MIKIQKKQVYGILLMILIIMSCSLIVNAKDNKENINGKVYVFEDKDDYELKKKKGEDTNKDNTYGNLSIVGDVKKNGAKDDVPVYHASSSEKVSLLYKYDNTLLKNGEDKWHLVKDKSKKVGEIKLDNDILNGAMILQISQDNSKWITVDTKVNIFEEVPTQNNSFYELSEMELINGCYYRVIFVYKLSKKIESSKFWVFEKKNYEEKKVAEVYNFYVYDKENHLKNINDKKKTKLGRRVKTEDEGYTGSFDIDQDDSHYGWDLGNFFVSGYSGKNMLNGKNYFLKNVGDDVTLGFYLNDDIDQLNKNEKISIDRDKKGYDKYFEISPTDFGRGTLIVRYTNPDGVTSDPQIYTNYLEANLSPAANTVVKLCEEGDYEVALDYKIMDKNKNLIKNESYYRIFVQFSVRNSNSMVYTFDSESGDELLNGNITNNGFYIDLANSQYLDVSIKKEILEEGADGLTEDIRFNRKAKDKETYTEDGIYTITVKNKAAELESVKKIYVGDNRILRAYMITGLPIREIKKKIDEGATITEEGVIIETKNGKTEEIIENTIENMEITTELKVNEKIEKEEEKDFEINKEDNSNKKDISDIKGNALIILIVIGILIIFYLIRKKLK